MNDKNPFTYATKKLSQDAFICSMLANYNTIELEDDAYRLLNLLMGIENSNDKFKVGDIKELDTKRQLNYIDIVVDFWITTLKDPQSHYIIAIEDKTSSSLHN